MENILNYEIFNLHTGRLRLLDRNCPRAKPLACSLDIWRGSLEMTYAPKGATGLSPGFQPWGPQNNMLALKGREADLIKLAPIRCKI
jgi:hypothetical protein